MPDALRLRLNAMKIIFIFFITALAAAAIAAITITAPLKSFAGGPDGTADNFINQNPFAFSMHKPDTFTSFNAMQYSGYNQAYNNAGVPASKPLQEQFLFIPAFVFTYNFLKKVNFFEISFPMGRQFTQGAIAQKTSNGDANIMFTNGYRLVGGGIGSPVIFYGIEAWNGNIGEFKYNFMPMLAVVIPNGWSSGSVNNIGSGGFNFEPALTGSAGYLFSKNFRIALDYAIGESYNRGHGSINYAEAAQAAPLATTASAAARLTS